MQDNRIHIDEKFTNHAWGEMSKLLAKEMPVQGQPQRRLAWWWFAVLAVGLGLAGTSLWLWGKRVPATAATPAKPVAESKFETATEQVPTTATTGTNAASENSDLESQPVLKTAQVSQSAPIFLHNQRRTITGKIPTQQAEALNKLVDEQPASLGVPKAVTYEMPSTTSAASLSNIEGGAIGEAYKIEAPSQLENAGLHLLTAARIHKPSASSMVIDPFDNNWKIGIQTDALTAITNKAAGFSVKFIAAKSLDNSRLSFETGFGYTYLQQPLQVVVSQYPMGVNSAVDSEVVYGTDQVKDNQGGFSPQANVRTNYSEGLNLHYVVLPAQASFRLSNRFSVHAGVDAGILLASSSDITNGGLFKRSLELADFSFEAEQRSDIKVSLIDVAATGLIRYFISPALSVHAGYKLGFKDILPNNSVNDFNRFVQIGIRYELRSKR